MHQTYLYSISHNVRAPTHSMFVTNSNVNNNIDDTLKYKCLIYCASNFSDLTLI